MFIVYERRTLVPSHLLALCPMYVWTDGWQVMIEEYFKRLALPSKTCPVTGEKFRPKKDVIPLVQSGSSFAGGGAKIAKSWRPSG